MAKMKPETRVSRLIAKMGPLADWLEKNKPTVKIIRVTPDDMALLDTFPNAAFSCGIIKKDGEFCWNGYTLKPTPGIAVERETV